MNYTIENDLISYTLNSHGLVTSIYNKVLGHEYCKAEGEIFRGIFAYGEYEERSINAANQSDPEIKTDGTTMTVYYSHLKGPEETINVTLLYTFTLKGNQIFVNCDIENNDDVTFPELQTTAFAGLGALDKDPEKDTLLCPSRLGKFIKNPTHTDFFKVSDIKKKYERRDNIHSDYDLLYPGSTVMQWFAIFNENESIYIGNHDPKHRILSMHTERRMSDNTIRVGTCQYPFLEKGEKYSIPTLVYAICNSDWHECSKIYRKWMVEEYGWKAPNRPEWAQEFQGFLRCIFRTQSGEYNFKFKDIPRMFDEVREAGLNTLFVLGWPRRGFGQYRPDYYLKDEDVEDFKKGVEYVHSKGGKLLMYVSYHAVDKFSEYYKEENGEETLMRDFWGNHVLFQETYSFDATYRKICNNPHPQFCTCSGSDKWHEKMIKSSNYCLDLGADGVLYDLGGTKPIFCFAKGHDHNKPNESRASKARRYSELRANLKRYGDDKITLQELPVDIYSQFQDIVQPPVFELDNKMFSPEMYMYTFPEVKMTNRNNALDEIKYHRSVNYSFLYNLAFDLSIFRCAGLPSDIPNYTAYMKEIIKIREANPKYLIHGLFCDEEGFTVKNHVMRNKAYRAEDGSIGITVWNESETEQTETYTDNLSGKSVTVTVPSDRVTFVKF